MRRALAIALMLTAPVTAQADFEWATWGPPSGNTSIARFSTCQAGNLTADFTGVSAGVPAGSEFTSNPPIYGRPDEKNPPFQRFMSGPSTPPVITQGAIVATLDLAGIAGASKIILGIGDQKFQYGVELQNASGVIPAQTWTSSVAVVSYNITYTASGLIADRNSTLGAPLVMSNSDRTTSLQDGILTNDGHNDAGGTYTQTGLTTLELPAGTQKIVLTAQSKPLTQQPEGLQIYLGADLPQVISYQPATSMLTIPSVQVGTTMYSATLKNIGDYTFALQCALQQAASGSTPATYDAASTVLTLPSVKVDSTTYVNVTLQNVGNYTFKLLSATAQP